MKNRIFQNLKTATEQHLGNKRYIFRAKKPKNDRKTRKPLKDSNGDIIYSNQLYDPTPSKAVILSFAFNMALENYQNIRPNKEIKAIPKLSDLSEMLIRFFSNKYYNRIEDIVEGNRLVDSEQNYEYAALKRFQHIEYKLYGVVERFRNYHSHYIHEPGVLTFKDLFDTDKTISQKDFDDAKSWFVKRFDDAHTHLLSSLSNRKIKLEELLKEEKKLEEKKEIQRKIKEIKGVKSAFSEIKLLDNGHITIEGQLFIACIFLTKRQAKVILDKWRGLKNISGYGNTLHTFYTYYSLRERYSINNYNDDLLKFRSIVSRLSTLPYIENQNLTFIYDKIKALNAIHYEELEKFPDGLSQKIEKLKDKKRPWEIQKLEKVRAELEAKESLQKKIIPIRKKKIFVQVLLQYLLDNNLFENKSGEIKFRIAVKKTPTDRLAYYEKYGEIDNAESLTQLKQRIKNETDKEKSGILNEHLKELKRNFVFKTPKELSSLLDVQEEEHADGKKSTKQPMGYRFSIRKNNALLQYTYRKEKNRINVVLSPDLLLKWVFLHLEKQVNIIDEIEHYINIRYNKLVYTDVDEIVDYYVDKYPDIHLKNLIPKSFLQVIERGNAKTIKERGNAKTIKERTRAYLNTRIKELEQFQALNNREAKPWKFASKRKIDTLLRYIHFRLLDDVYVRHINKEEEEVDFIRHTSFNMNTYDIAREYFRYFGRYKNNTIHQLGERGEEYVEPIIVTKMKDEHPILFDYIKGEIENSNSLEELFDQVMKNYIRLLQQYTGKIADLDEGTLAKVFKIRPPSDKDEINNLLEKMFSKTIEISGQIISVKKEMEEDWNEFIKQKEDRNKKYMNYSEFSFIRARLSETTELKTNVDFILQRILPTIPKAKDRKISKVFKLLLRQKTEELMLWKIAKYYWKKANRNPYVLEATAKIDNDASSFHDFCFFNKVYHQDLDYKIEIDEKCLKQKFQDVYQQLPEDGKSLSFVIKVPARKYDNKFILYETSLIKEYMIWHHFDSKTKKIQQVTNFRHPDKNIKRTFDLNQYEDVIKLVYKELVKSISYIGALLRAEKRIVERDHQKFMDLLGRKYQDQHPIIDFYIALTNKREKKPLDVELFDVFLQRTTSEEEKHLLEEYLINFRNYALHYQLQDPQKLDSIWEFLKKINEKTKNFEYVTKD